MEIDYINLNESPPIGNFKKIMSHIEFMQSYMEDPDIFKPDSASLRRFLIESFCFLYSDFHYLSYLGKNVDTEIRKVSQILQILPSSTKNNLKLFDNMSKDDINKFWLKFFSLFTKQHKSTGSIDSGSNIILEDKIHFFKDIKSTFNYINYEIPTLYAKKLNSVNISEEIDSWKQPFISTSNSAGDESVLLNTDDETMLSNTDEEQTNQVDIEKLIVDVKHTMSVYSNTKNPTTQQINPDYVDFFCTFISLAESILQYQKNLLNFGSPFLDENNFKMLSSDKDLLGNLYYIKRCNNFVRTLNSKMKSLL